jgi:hypothetical protein
MTARRFDAIANGLFIGLINQRRTWAERLDWAEIAHQHNQISDEQLAFYEEHARERV